MTNWTLLKREHVVENARIVCGIGHVVHADIFTATYRCFDMDGSPMQPFTVEEYDPPTCVVCGLRLWSRKS